MLGAFGLFFWLFVAGLAGAMYFLPTILALMLHRRNAGVVALINTLFGWSFVGWVISLVLAIMRERETVQVVHVHQQISYPQVNYQDPKPAQVRKVPGSNIEPR